jgi:hypothetical protein
MEMIKKSRQERGNSRFDKLVALIKTRNGISLRDLKKNHGFEEQETRQIIDENPRVLWIEEPKKDGKRGRKPSPMVWLVGWKQAVRQAVAAEFNSDDNYDDALSPFKSSLGATSRIFDDSDDFRAPLEK